MVKQLTADPGIASLIPITPTKITERRYVLVIPRKNAPVYQRFTLSTWFVMCGGRYGPLSETNNLYTLTPNRQMCH